MCGVRIGLVSMACLPECCPYAHFKQGPEAVEMIEQAVSKLEAALKINPKKHDALWCLGNALTSQGFLYQEASKAKEYGDSVQEAVQAGNKAQADRAIANAAAVVDPTGAGDAFKAGFISEWKRMGGNFCREDVQAALGVGCAAGAFAVSQLGACATQATRERICR